MAIKYSILNKDIFVDPTDFTYSFCEEDLQETHHESAISLTKEKINCTDYRISKIIMV